MRQKMSASGAGHRSNVFYPSYENHIFGANGYKESLTAWPTKESFWQAAQEHASTH